MNTIIIAIIIVATVGLISGLGLAIASIIMAVPVDEKAEAILEILPGANCGACGYTGCAGYSSALSSGETTKTNLCTPGGNETAQSLAQITGLAAEGVSLLTAVVLCQGNLKNCDLKLEYSGVKSCAMAQQLFGGPKDCIYGCIGFGDCVNVCPYNAIKICDGIAVVNPLACRACNMCVTTCPKNIIELVPMNESKTVVLCKSKEKGAVTRKQCKAGCIACMRCVKACEFDAIHVNDNCAHVDYDKCTACNECVEVCPVNCIALISHAES